MDRYVYGTYTDMYICICTHACMYFICTHTHTHTHTHMQKPSLEEMWTAKRAEILRRLGLPERSGGAGGARRGGGASGGGGDLVVVNRGKTPPAASLLRDSYETGTRPLRVSGDDSAAAAAAAARRKKALSHDAEFGRARERAASVNASTVPPSAADARDSASSTSVQAASQPHWESSLAPPMEPGPCAGGGVIAHEYIARYMYLYLSIYLSSYLSIYLSIYIDR